MEHVGVVRGVPLGIAKEGIKLAQRRVGPLIAPSETSVLEVNFLKFTGMKRGAKAVDSACIDIPFIFVPSPINLVEAPGSQPGDTRQRFVI